MGFCRFEIGRDHNIVEILYRYLAAIYSFALLWLFEIL